MESPRIVLSGHSPAQEGLRWDSDKQLRIGRLHSLEIYFEDSSVSRRHAEIVLLENEWTVRDLGSSNGTFVNGVRVGRTGQKLRRGDIVECGLMAMRVDVLQEEQFPRIKASGHYLTIQATAKRSWEQALDGLVPSEEQWQEHGREFLTLLRSGYRLGRGASLDESLHAVLGETVAFFKAQRGGIFLADPITGQLLVRAQAVAKGPLSPRKGLSKTLAFRAFRQSQSLLFKDCSQDTELRAAQSVAPGTMSSTICALLRSPDKTLGVLHLDRGPLQDPFTEADFFLADSQAAAMSLGIERMQMAEGQQDLFLHTITALAQAVELRDRYTGHHTQRVTTYALLLAEELGLSPAERRVLQLGTPLHDIGKIAIDDQILRKAGSLSAEEFGKMKTHVLHGAEIVHMVPGLSAAIPIIRHHHERWDGNGYPDRLAGDRIPRLARVVALVDAFDAMTSDRPYRPGIPLPLAFAEVERQAGIHFDPECVRAFLRLRPRIEELLTQEASLRQLSETGEKTMTGPELEKQVRTRSSA